MFVQYSLKNYKSYNETCTLNFMEARITEFTDTLYVNEADGVGLIPLFLLYGPNGSGKSSLFDSLLFLKGTVMGTLMPNPYYKSKPSCKNKPTEFDLTFRSGNLEYNYVLKTKDAIVVEETLFRRQLPDPNYDVVLDRDEDGIFLGELLEHISVEQLEDNITMLAFLHTNQIPNDISDALEYLLGLDIYDPQQNQNEHLTMICKTSAYKQQLLHHLQQVGIDLVDITPADQTFMLTYSSKLKLSLNEDSQGIQRLLDLLSYLLLHSSSPTPILIENLEYNLHPQIVAYLLGLFSTQRSKQTSCQLMVSSFDMSVMSNHYLRRDEIWLCEKTGDGSTVYSLAEYRKEQNEKVRKDETYFKQYLEGRYGALPKLTVL